MEDMTAGTVHPTSCLSPEGHQARRLSDEKHLTQISKYVEVGQEWAQQPEETVGADLGDSVGSWGTAQRESSPELVIWLYQSQWPNGSHNNTAISNYATEELEALYI